MGKSRRKELPQNTPSIEAIQGTEEEEDDELPITVGGSDSDDDICAALLQRYQKSSAPQHRHLCASAAAIRSIIIDEGLPLTPPAYFAAAISSIQSSTSLDPDATAALASFLPFLLPHVPRQSLPPPKANDAAAILARRLGGLPETASAATVRSLVKSLGFVLPLCNVEDWGVVELPLETLLEFSADRRPKVRKCAQACLEKIFMSFGSAVCKRASKMVLSMFESNIPLAVELSAIRNFDGSKGDIPSKLKHVEVLHMLNTLKLIFPFISKTVAIKLLPDLHKLLQSHFSPITRHILSILVVLFDCPRLEIPASEVENIMVALVSYVSYGGENPVDTVMSASGLLKSGLDKLHEVERNAWIRNLPLVFRSVTGLLSSEENSATRAVEILKEMINLHIDSITLQISANQLNDGGVMGTPESAAIESICNAFVNIVSAFGGIPNEHTLVVISDLFLKLGEFSYLFMKGILLKLADQLMGVSEDKLEMKHLQDCIGFAVIAMGPEKILSLLPITFHEEKLSCSNIWLIPILKKYVIGASLNFFLEQIVPLARSIKTTCSRVKRSPVIRDLQNCVHDLFDLLPAFCRYPTDTPQTIEALVKLLVVLLKDSSMHGTISLALQELVNQNKDVIQEAKRSPNKSTALNAKDAQIEFQSVPSRYSKKIASRNIRHLSSCSMDMLQALIDAFFNSPLEKRAQLKVLKDAIGCLASITDRSNVKYLFLSLSEKFKSIDSAADPEKLENHIQVSANMEQGGNKKEQEKEEAQRCAMIELASCLVEGADEDFVNIVFEYIRPSLQASDGIGQSEAYYTLSKIFKEHSWFYSSRVDELLDILLGLKSAVDVLSLRNRLTCFHFLLVHLLRIDLEKTNSKAFFILNEIILTLKDSNKETRRAAYDTLLMISCSLKISPTADSDETLHRLFSMIIGYLSGESPHIMSGAVAALSLLIYEDPSLCFATPDLMPSILILLKSKANEVIKAVLGFMKVFVSCLFAKDLKEILSDIVNGVLPWSSVSKHHFRSKVRIILEIAMRKCGFDSIELVTPKKYKGFIKSIAELRKSKSSSTGAANSDEALKLAETVPKGGRKRMREESAFPREKTSSQASGTTQRGKGWKKLKPNISSTKDFRKATTNGNDSQQRIKNEHSHSEKRNKQRNFGKKLRMGGKVMNKRWRKDSGSDRNGTIAPFKSHQNRRGAVKPRT